MLIFIVSEANMEGSRWQEDSHGTGAAVESVHLILKSEAGSRVSSLVYSPPSKNLKMNIANKHSEMNE